MILLFLYLFSIYKIKGSVKKWSDPEKLDNIFEEIVQATERACCLWRAGGKPFSFILILRLL